MIRIEDGSSERVAAGTVLKNVLYSGTRFFFIPPTGKNVSQAQKTQRNLRSRSLYLSLRWCSVSVAGTKKCAEVAAPTAPAS